MQKENKYRFPSYEIEDSIRELGYKYIAGVDEVGRGPGAGPVVASAIIIPINKITLFISRIKDSKKLTARKREFLFKELTTVCEYGVGKVDNKIIDEINILNATKRAMTEAISKINPDFILIDGPIKLDGILLQQKAIINGDNKSISIAAASIIAKVIRDEEMRTLHWIYPEYDFINNKGYLTPNHIVALKEYGPCKYHRLSFNKVF